MQMAATGNDICFLTQFLSSLNAVHSAALETAMADADLLARTAPPSSSSVSVQQNQPMEDMLGRSRLNGEEIVWNLDTDVAFVCTRFDPASRQRRAVIASARHAAFFGMHREEFLARAAAHDLPLLFSERDILAMLLHTSTAELFRRGAPGESFFRMCVGSGRRAGVLMAVRASAQLDELGRVVEVLNLARSPAHSARVHARTHRARAHTHRCTHAHHSHTCAGVKENEEEEQEGGTGGGKGWEK